MDNLYIQFPTWSMHLKYSPAFSMFGWQLYWLLTPTTSAQNNQNAVLGHTIFSF